MPAYIDLPMHSATVAPDYATIDGPECLAVKDDGQRAVITAAGFSGVNGFVTTAALPAGATLYQAVFVVSAYRTGGGDHEYDPLHPVSSYTYPSLLMGGINGIIGHPALEPLPFSTYGELTVTDFFGTIRYLPPEYGGPALGSAVAVFVFGGPSALQGVPGYPPVYIDYAAVRLYYLTSGQPPRRIYPRDDALTGGARRVFPPNKTRQRGNRVVGGYL